MITINRTVIILLCTSIIILVTTLYTRKDPTHQALKTAYHITNPNGGPMTDQQCRQLAEFVQIMIDPNFKNQ